MKTRAEQINFEQAVYDAFGQVKDFTLAMRIARYFYEQAEKDTKEALLEWLRKEYETVSWYYEKMKHVTGCIGDNSSSGKAEAYKKVIDKIESL